MKTLAPLKATVQSALGGLQDRRRQFHPLEAAMGVVVWPMIELEAA
jgi:hypothetical protein